VSDYLFPPVVETERLRLERLDESVDARELYGVVSARTGDDGIGEVTEHVPWSPHRTVQETREFLDHAASQWTESQSAEYAVRPKAGEPGAGAFAGCCGLTCRWDRSVAEPGIWLRKPFWGRGYSGERARALVALAFDRLDLDVVRVGVAAANERSRRAVATYVAALGGREEGVRRRGLVIGPDDVRDEVCFSLTQAEWRDATDGEFAAVFADSER
jgi:RimJ/RimL family protein N-acetyltransferase